MGRGDPISDRPLRPRDVAADLEVLDGLLSTLTDVLDIREVFERVSQLLQRVLPHDILGIMGSARREIGCDSWSPLGFTEHRTSKCRFWNRTF